ncbi:MAG: GAF domain-containing protein [Thermomicrobiales bacterium]
MTATSSGADGAAIPQTAAPLVDGAGASGPRPPTPMAPSVALARVVFDLTQRLGQFQTAEALLDTVADEMARLVPNDRLAIVLFRGDGSDRQVNRRFARGDSLDFRSGHPSDLPEGPRLSALTEPLLYTIEPHGPFVGDPDRWASGFRQAAVAPLKAGDEQIGLFTLMSKQADAFDESDLWILSSLAAALAMMLAATDLRVQAEQGQREAEFLASLGAEATATRSEQALFALVTRRLNEAFDCTIGLYRQRADGLHLDAIEVASSLDPRVVRVLAMTLLELTESPVWMALGVPPVDTPIVIEVGPEEVPGVNPLLLEEMRRRDVHALLAMPIVWDGEPLGVIGVSQNLRHPGAPGIPWDRQADVLRRVADTIAPVLANLTLHESLTRALNESELLRSILSDTTRQHDPAEGLDVLARAAHLLYSADYVAVGRAVGQRFDWRVQVGSRFPAISRETAISPRLQAAIDGQVPVLVRNFPHDPPVDQPELYPIHQTEGLLASLTIPFEIEDGGRGVLLVGHRRPHQFDAADIRFARSLGAAVAARLLSDA